MWPEPTGAANVVGRAFAVSGALSQVLDHEISSTQPLARQVEHALGQGP